MEAFDNGFRTGPYRKVRPGLEPVIERYRGPGRRARFQLARSSPVARHCAAESRPIFGRTSHESRPYFVFENRATVAEYGRPSRELREIFGRPSSVPRPTCAKFLKSCVLRASFEPVSDEGSTSLGRAPNGLEIVRASIDRRPQLGRRTPVCRASFGRLLSACLEYPPFPLGCFEPAVLGWVGCRDEALLIGCVLTFDPAVGRRDVCLVGAGETEADRGNWNKDGKPFRADTSKMTDKVRRFLVLLLITLKDSGPAAACSSSSCSSSSCICVNEGLSSVPQDLPTNTTYLELDNNVITTMSESNFSRYSNLTTLRLNHNQISVINSGAFYSITRLTELRLSGNQLTSLRQDIFVGLDNLQVLSLGYNNIHNIEAGTFDSTPQLGYLTLYNNQLTILRAGMFVGLDNLQYLSLDHNDISSIEAETFSRTRQLRELWLTSNSISTIAPGTFANLPLHSISIFLSSNGINTFPVEAFSNLNISTLKMDHNQMETPPSTAYDILASCTNVDISNNPWQCDCRMLPFKQKMTGFPDFEKHIRCAGPENVEGKSLLLAVEPEDLNCEETNTDTAFFPIWCIKRRGRRKTGPAPDPSDAYSKPNGSATGLTSGPHHTGQGASPSRAAESDDGESRPGTSGTVPPPCSFDKSYPLPPIKMAGPQGDVQNMPEAAHGTGDATANMSVPLSRHFIYQQTCPSGLPKGLAGL
ncbi:hypothetical protein Bbelb_233670 [Branchiostoma belcheri]|nr:hypothetical protein Bbelb_233670 [Branchiostoma belcheri]